MSFIAPVDVEVKSISALEKTCEYLGLKMEARPHYRRHEMAGRAGIGTLPEGITTAMLDQCSYVLSVPNNGYTYEVGVIKHPTEDRYVMIYDNYMGGFGLEEMIGEGAVKLRQAYPIFAAQEQLTSEGFMTQIIESDGDIELIAEK